MTKKEIEQNRLIDFLRASFVGFWMTTTEPTRVKQIYYESLPLYKKKDGSSFIVKEWSCLNDPKPETPLLQLSNDPPNTILFLYNYHFFIGQPKVIQLIQDCIPEWSNQGKAIVIVSALQKIPPELDKDFTLINLDLPGRQEIIDIMALSVPDESYIPTGKDLDEAVKASKSLTARELSNVYSLSLVKKKRLDVITINDYRAQAIKKSGFAEVMKSNLTFDDVIGYEEPKAQVMSTIHNPKAKGVIWIGPPGTGKSSLGKAIANESNKLALQVHTGAFLSKYQGESDRLQDEFIRMIYGIGECYLFFDEFDKQFAGGEGDTGQLDSGTGKRQIGRWLEFFQDRPPGVYINTTCNSFVGVPSALFRVGRWDSAPWYVGLPNDKVKSKILDYYIKKEELTDRQIAKIPKMPNWTGSEIEGLCHNAEMRNLTLMEAERYICPMYETRKEEIQALEQWAKGRTVMADELPAVITAPTKKRKLDL